MAKKPNRKERRLAAKAATAPSHTENTPQLQHSAPQDRKPMRLLAWFSSTWGMFWSGVVACSTVFGVITGTFFFWPQLSATPSTTLVEADPLSTFFIIANEGNLDIHDAQFSCRINYATDGKGINIAMAENNLRVFRPKLPAKEKIGLPCLAGVRLS